MATTPLFFLLSQSDLSPAKLGTLLAGLAPRYGGEADAEIPGHRVTSWTKTPGRMPRWARLASFELALANGFKLLAAEEQRSAIRSFRILHPAGSFEEFAESIRANIPDSMSVEQLRPLWQSDASTHG